MQRRLLWWLSLAAIALSVTLLFGFGRSHSAAISPPASVPAAAIQLAQAPDPAPDSAAEPAALVISGNYEDPQGQFQVGIIEGYTVGSAAGAPLFESPDGSLAYSVVAVPVPGGGELSDIGLVDLAQSTFGRGEGFQTRSFSPIDGGGLQIAWTGRLTKGAAPPLPITGLIVAKQQGETAYLLIVSATNASAEQVPTAAATLASSLEALGG